MKPAGYLVNTEEGPEGQPGLYYDYILAGNGLFVRAESPLLKATVCVAGAEVRGLPPLVPKLELPHGKIPQHFYYVALSFLSAEPYWEHYLAITWEGEYRIREPPQEIIACGVKYEILPGVVMDIHSHSSMGAFFSRTDDEDERGLRLYMVVGRLDTLLPEVKMRVGVYGYFSPVQREEVFIE